MVVFGVREEPPIRWKLVDVGGFGGRLVVG